MSAAPDEYEQKYMGGGEAIVRDRRGMPRWMHAMFALPMLIELIAGIAVIAAKSPVGLINLAMIIPMGLLWMLFMFLRITLTNDTLHVQYGLLGPKIELSQVKSVSAGTYDWKQYGGWGIRKRKGVTAYSTPGDTNDCLILEWVDASGKTQNTVVTTDKAKEFAEEIQRRIATSGASSTSSTGVRVDTPAPADTDPAEVALSDVAASEQQKQRS